MWNYISSCKVLFGHFNKIKDYWEIPSWKIQEVHGFVLSMLEVLLQVCILSGFFKARIFFSFDEGVVTRENGCPN